jgi:hypothetical protein
MRESHLEIILQLTDFNPGGEVWEKFTQRDCDLVYVVRSAVYAHCKDHAITGMEFNDLCYLVLRAMQQRVGGF